MPPNSPHRRDELHGEGKIVIKSEHTRFPACIIPTEDKWRMIRSSSIQAHIGRVRPSPQPAIIHQEPPTTSKGSLSPYYSCAKKTTPPAWAM
ncbi:UNVERIFIED_CONTAM: hypothetical protein Slati_2208900 [Sesamum latifolium]|uniref:Uncharacterized protein n=1 Tax=Sesamum latifolium TaxID=2727402 RepID=A0AAW2WT14_9LAMI